MENIESNTAKFIGSYQPQTVKSSTFRFNHNHILYGRLRPYLNKVLAPNFQGHCSTEIFPIKPSECLNKNFLLYWLLMDSTVNNINKTCTGARMPRANMTAVFEFDFPLPPLPEQKRIVAILDEAFEGIDRAISNTEKNLSNARELFESYLNSIFSQKGEGWEEKKLEDVCQFENGDRGKNYPNREEYVESGIPWINTGHIQPNGTLSQSEMNFITQEKYESLRSGKIRPGDLVYCLRGATIGKTALVAPFTVGAIASSLVIIRPSNLLDSHFLYYFLTSSVGKRQIKLYDNGAAQPNLGAKSVAKYIIYLPNFAEQKVIVQKLVDLSNETQRLENIYRQKIAALKELKQSILQKAFTGELTADKGITAMEETAA
ncbi:restriction endonuclease subunit S [Aphanizomenon flos-aquae]|uniref:restriction endonuclease subunit S n=1 Tax=Aphanizomenon flos-aquae TaxID=1176 RepID=UPI0004AD2009|nr:restriction endonuclease subunit S [Aphanizomenon flos-aquae]